MLKQVFAWVCLLALCCLSANVQAAYLLEVDTDGADDGTVTFNPNFSFGGDTTTASQSSASTAFGMTGGDSIFGGDGSNSPDTYVVTYDPSAQADNLAIPAGTDLGEGDLATGLVGGGAGLYTVYATWPFTSSVSGGLTEYSVMTSGDSFNVSINQNDADDLSGSDGRGHVWVNLGTIDYTSGDITVTQQPADANSFVSMRLAGVLFERAIPEPTSSVLLAVSVLAMLSTRRRGVK